MTKSNKAEQFKYVVAIKPSSICHNGSVSILQYSGILATKRWQKDKKESSNENVPIRKWGLWSLILLS